MTLLTVADLNVFYGRLQAVRAVSFAVDAGQTVALLGANGAGKSSVLRAVAGVVDRVEGDIVLDGTPMRTLPPEKRVQRGLAAVMESRDLFQTLTVKENLMMGAFRRSDRPGVRRDFDRVLDLFPVLASRLGAVASSLSGGQAQMLAIGRALMTGPRLLLLDEPSHGLAPNMVEVVFALLPRLRQEQGLGILLVEQNANRALQVSDRAYVMENGEIALSGAPADLARDTRVKHLYLGG